MATVVHLEDLEGGRAGWAVLGVLVAMMVVVEVKVQEAMETGTNRIVETKSMAPNRSSCTHWYLRVRQEHLLQASARRRAPPANRG